MIWQILFSFFFLLFGEMFYSMVLGGLRSMGLDISWGKEASLLLKRNVDIKTRTIFLSGDVIQGTSHIFDKLMTLLENISEDPITIRLNTDGGDLYETFSIIDRAAISACSVITIGHGRVCSAGVYLMAMGDMSISSPHTVFMHHRAHINFGNGDCRVDEIEKEIRETVIIEDTLAEFLGSRTLLSKKQWNKLASNGDYYFNSKLALKYGLVDEIESPTKATRRKKYDVK